LDTRHRKKTRTPPKKIDTENIGHKTEKDTDPTKKDRHGEHWTQDAERRHTLHQKKIDTENIGHKTQKEDTDRTKKDRYGEHWAQDAQRRHTLHQKR
jgi:hypothetical protein